MAVTTFKSIIEGKQSKLEEKIDTEHGLLSKLEEYRVITRRHRTAIEVNITFYCCWQFLQPNLVLLCQIEVQSIT